MDQLEDASHVDKVVTLTRRPSNHTSPKVFNYVVDFEHLERSASLFEGRYLFSTLGTTRRQAGSVEAQRRVDLDYQFEAARLAADSGVQYYLLLSSSFADHRSGNYYRRMKGELEQKVIALDFPRVSIFQPFVLVGKRDEARPLEQVGALVLRAVSAIPGLSEYRPISGKDVAAKIVRVSNTPGASREWFRLGEMFT